MFTNENMKYVEKFEDDGFVYELSVSPSSDNNPHIYTASQGFGYYCRWNIVEKNHAKRNVVSVTDDDCELIIFESVESAVKGAKAFLNL
ncbi:MAG TPA: hypothetical protein VGD40_07650 [Chryseosolibacter sp.]